MQCSPESWNRGDQAFLDAAARVVPRSGAFAWTGPVTAYGVVERPAMGGGTEEATASYSRNATRRESRFGLSKAFLIGESKGLRMTQYGAVREHGEKAWHAGHKRSDGGPGRRHGRPVHGPARHVHGTRGGRWVAPCGTPSPAAALVPRAVRPGHGSGHTFVFGLTRSRGRQTLRP